MNALTELVPIYPALLDPHCDAILVHCSDPRFQPAFREFAATELGLGPADVMSLVVSGGASVLAHPLRLPKEFKFMRDRLAFYRAVMPSLKRVVLINHEGCRYSRALKKRVLGEGAEDDGQHDLRVVRARLAPTLAQLELVPELFYARFCEGGTHITFERVA
jgi:hypothetical protein